MRKADACSRYISIKIEMKQLEEELKDITKEIRKDLEIEFRQKGSVTKSYGNYTVSLTEQKRNSVDSFALKEAGLFEQYSKQTIAEYLKVTKN